MFTPFKRLVYFCFYIAFWLLFTFFLVFIKFPITPPKIAGKTQLNPYWASGNFESKSETWVILNKLLPTDNILTNNVTYATPLNTLSFFIYLSKKVVAIRATSTGQTISRTGAENCMIVLTPKLAYIKLNTQIPITSVWYFSFPLLILEK